MNRARKIVYLRRNGVFHFAVALRDDGTEPSSILDLANSLGTELEPNEHFNAIYYDPSGNGTTEQYTPPGEDPYTYQQSLIAALNAANIAPGAVLPLEWIEGTASFTSVTSTSTTTSTTTT
jgi:hypothetical protein